MEQMLESQFRDMQRKAALCDEIAGAMIELLATLQSQVIEPDAQLRDAIEKCGAPLQKYLEPNEPGPDENPEARAGEIAEQEKATEGEEQ